MKIRAIVFSLEWILANTLVLRVLDDRYSFHVVPWVLWNITFGIFLFKLFSAPKDDISVWPIGPTVGAFGFVLTAIKIRDPADDGEFRFVAVLGYGICLLGLALIGIASDTLGDDWKDAPPPESSGDKDAASTDEASKLVSKLVSTNKIESKPPNLVTTGPYGLVRHPIYCGLLMEALGSNVVGGFSSWIALTALASVTAAYTIQLGQEERELNLLLDGQYDGDYKEKTRYKLVPFVY